MWQTPNPYDLLFFAAEAASVRLGLPGATAYMVVELARPVDARCFARAVHCLSRAYPVLGAQCERHQWMGSPRWRLPAGRVTPRDLPPGAQRDADHAASSVPAQLLEIPPGGLAAELDRLFNQSLRIGKRPPLEFRILRQNGAGDTIVMRWSHALMDGGGGLALLEALDDFYHQETEPRTVTTRGDESRRDFETLLRSAAEPAPRAPASMPSAAAASSGEARQWLTSSFPRRYGPQFLVRRRLDENWLAAVNACAARAGPDVRTSDWLRAAALAALDERAPGRDGRYTLRAYMDHRRIAPGAVCWNFNVAVPLEIPTFLVCDRVAAARHLRKQLSARVGAGFARADARRLWYLTRIPTSVLAAMLCQRFRSGRSPGSSAVIRAAPSLPLGLLGGLQDRRRSLCSQPIAAFYAYRAPMPQPGYVIDVTLSHAGAVVVASGIEPRAQREALGGFVDRFLELAASAPADREPRAAPRGKHSASIVLQRPGPLDRLFVAGELAASRARLSGPVAHLVVELDGSIEIARLQVALEQLALAYPAICGRVRFDARSGQPAWYRSGQPVPLHLDVLDGRNRLDHERALLRQPIRSDQGPPLRLHVLRARSDDSLLLRWSHALMDGGGALLLMKALDEAYRCPGGVLPTTSDEQRRDYRHILGTSRSRGRRRPATFRLPPMRRQSRLLAHAARHGSIEAYALERVTLDDAQVQDVALAARRIAGIWPSADYVRAAALASLHTLSPGRLVGERYRTNVLVDHRRAVGPAVCWNLFSTLPVEVRPEDVGDLAASTRAMQRQVLAALRDRFPARELARLQWLARMPSHLLGEVLRRRVLSPAAAARDPRTPSIRIDFIDFRPLGPVFCGQPVGTMAAYPALLPCPGIALDVALLRDGLSVVGVGAEPLIDRAYIRGLVARFIDTLRCGRA